MSEAVCGKCGGPLSMNWHGWRAVEYCPECGEVGASGCAGPSDCSADFLALFGDFGPTVKGDELKGWIHDPEDGGVYKKYLSASDCREAARQFMAAADILESNALNHQQEEVK